MKNKEIDKEKLISAIREITGSDVSLKPDVSIQDWLRLKEAISPVNNMITVELTKEFIRRLPQIVKDVSLEDVGTMLDSFAQVNVNANGYDFCDEKNKIVAEVKANIPYEGNKYGAAQKDGLAKDIKGLLEGKTKGEVDPTEYYKFLVVLKYENEQYSTDEALKNFVKRRSNVEIWNGNGTELLKDRVYIVPIGV